MAPPSLFYLMLKPDTSSTTSMNCTSCHLAFFYFLLFSMLSFLSFSCSVSAIPTIPSSVCLKASERLTFSTFLSSSSRLSPELGATIIHSSVVTLQCLHQLQRYLFCFFLLFLLFYYEVCFVHWRVTPDCFTRSVNKEPKPRRCLWLAYPLKTF